MKDQCHYVIEKGEKILIPGCMGSTTSGVEQCTCDFSPEEVEKEINFLNFVVNNFNLFDQKKRNRILDYLNDRYYKESHVTK